jgi:ParB family chromosome partitioning protein
LIPGGDSAGTGIQIRENPNYTEIPIDNIVPDPDQPRKRFLEHELNELAATLHSVGLIEPIVVRPYEGKYRIISGERRWRASKLAGFKKIPAVIKQVNDLQALEMGIIENIQREELTPIEEARAYEHWMEKTGSKPTDLAARVGRDRSTITNLIRLLKLPPEVQSMLDSGSISAGQARPLLSIGDRKTLLKLAEKISNEGWSARRVEDEVARIQSPEPERVAREQKSDPNVAALENRLRAHFTSRIQVQHKKDGSGKIAIGYANLDDLDRIIELLGLKKG